MFPLFYLTFSKLNLRNLYLASPYLTQPNFAEVYDVDLPLSYVRRPPLPPPRLALKQASKRCKYEPN